MYKIILNKIKDKEKIWFTIFYFKKSIDKKILLIYGKKKYYKKLNWLKKTGLVIK